MIGKVKFYNRTKGFGFITDLETGDDYFIHATGLLEDIKDNDDVDFELKADRLRAGGMQACEVTLVRKDEFDNNI
jgi:CspA family cold shock protein